mmetsp:Transcript_38471/g.83714  ORF Transcript_38471/g.83714 Transcript_38471/m.83714 type:complete len:252 (-) Transcript_38471:504-1259(-)
MAASSLRHLHAAPHRPCPSFYPLTCLRPLRLRTSGSRTQTDTRIVHWSWPAGAPRSQCTICTPRLPLGLPRWSSVRIDGPHRGTQPRRWDSNCDSPMPPLSIPRTLRSPPHTQLPPAPTALAAAWPGPRWKSRWTTVLGRFLSLRYRHARHPPLCFPPPRCWKNPPPPHRHRHLRHLRFLQSPLPPPRAFAGTKRCAAEHPSEAAASAESPASSPPPHPSARRPGWQPPALDTGAQGVGNQCKVHSVGSGH